MGIERMTLIGHSLGGYIVSAYALKYPERVDRLILLSPAGIVNHPEKGEDIVPDAEVMDNETREYIDSSLEHPGHEHKPHPRRPGIASAPTECDISRPGVSRENSAASVDSTNFEADKEAKRGNQGWWKKAVYYMWEEGVSPFGLVRKLGPVGPMLVAKYSTRRFAALPEEDIADLHDYVWTLTSARGSSEYAITHLLAPGAHARWPIADRVHKLSIPIAFVYGDHDCELHSAVYRLSGLLISAFFSRDGYQGWLRLDRLDEKSREQSRQGHRDQSCRGEFSPA